jgi:hypothetical protein
MNIADVREFGERRINKVYLSPTKQKICLKRLNVVELTRRFKVYEDIARTSQKLFNVQVYRNKSCLDEGIYVAGRENFVDEYIMWIEMVIRRTEKDTEEYGFPARTWGKVHGNKAYSIYASRIAKKILYTVLDLFTYRDEICTEQKASQCISDYLLISAYCTELSTLKTKTKYNGELRYIIPKGGRNKK